MKRMFGSVYARLFLLTVGVMVVASMAGWGAGPLTGRNFGVF